MKNKMITLEDDQIAFLSKQENASLLIRQLLIKHMKERRFEGLTMEELEKEEAIVNIQIEAEKKIKELRNGK